MAAAAGPAAPDAAKPLLPPPQQDAKAAETGDPDLKGKLLVRPFSLRRSLLHEIKHMPVIATLSGRIHVKGRRVRQLWPHMEAPGAAFVPHHASVSLYVLLLLASFLEAF